MPGNQNPYPGDLCDSVCILLLEDRLGWQEIVGLGGQGGLNPSSQEVSQGALLCPVERQGAEFPPQPSPSLGGTSGPPDLNWFLSANLLFLSMGLPLGINPASLWKVQVAVTYCYHQGVP